jgi:radical SAM superfamily enzyme YgiQ (UPF0313 family)
MHIILADTHGPILGKAQATPNLSLLYLATYANKFRPDVQFHYIPQKRQWSHHLEMVERLKPAIYAISFTSFGAPVALKMMRDLKSQFPDVKIICGGPHVTPFPRDVLEKSGCDVCVIGEGEVSFLELINDIDRIPNDIRHIRGIAYFSQGQYVQTATRPVIDDLDTIPIPDRRLVDQRDFVGLQYSLARPNTEMVITRGCPLRCVFCANPVFRLKNGPSFRCRSPKSIAEEVEYLYGLGYREIYLHSDELNVNLNWSIEVCKALAALNHPDLFFQCNMRVVPFNEELASWLKRANFWQIKFGIESSSDRVLRGIKKHMSQDKTIRACELTSNAGIKVYGFFMLYQMWEEAGEVQYETPEEVKATIAFARRLWRKGVLHYTTWQFAVPVHGAELYDIARRHGMIDDDFYPTHDWDIVDHLPHVTKRTFNRHFAEARRLQALMALSSGHIEWRNWRGIARKFMTMFRGNAEGKRRRMSDIDKRLLHHDTELRLPQFMEITSKARRDLMRHPLYQTLDRESDLRILMQSHVFAVWDFMTILKTLQKRLTCTDTPWMPPSDPLAARLINEIVLEEESDQTDDGIYTSHFDLYRSAMREIGADLTQIERFVELVRSGRTVGQALRPLQIPETTKKFVLETMKIQSAKTHEVVASFLMGREDVIPDMFRRFLGSLDEEQQKRYVMMRMYLGRHIDLDEDSHAPMGRDMMKRICGNDRVKWAEAVEITRRSLKMRRMLWDGVLEEIRRQKTGNGHTLVDAPLRPRGLLPEAASTRIGSGGRS